MARREKELVVEELTEKFQTAKSAVLTDYRGLDVEEVTELRDKLRDASVDYKVVKNTLAYLAAKEAGVEEIGEYLSGPTAIAFAEEDPVAPAQVLADFAEDHDDLEIKSGIVEGTLIDTAGVESLADIPPREVLLGQIARGMKAPISGLVHALNYPLQSLAYALNAVKEQKED
ncbi:ribosomal protein L10 [Halobacteroides halobius DSM 5150]|uniref:Large ribosomal subunit protein uL10 n=1 Tax=Halobacteroides halobius (strain ATCC 35273 / DSM 5150 / MD-1) TaxID=748449 RepID=L0K4J4_HALHC|nr:50S ribosomal protein L10 [Halobacteroides halobius]AGB40192.1 ribosomal protein L10 [Halobacteroides halobius DSM 5150]